MLELLITVVAGAVWGFRRGDFAVSRYILLAAIAGGLVLVLWFGMKAAGGLSSLQLVIIPAAFLTYFGGLAAGYTLGAYLKRLRISRDHEEI